MKENSKDEAPESQTVEVMDSNLMVVVCILFVLMLDWLGLTRCTC